MADKKQVEVLIGGKVYQITGSESEEHMKKVADFLNKRLRQTKTAMGGVVVSPEYLTTVSAINICDDLLKLVDLVHKQEEEIENLKKQKSRVENNLSKYEDVTMDLESEVLALKEEIKKMNETQEKPNAEKA